MRVEIKRCERDKRAYVFCSNILNGGQEIFRLYEWDVEQLLTGEEYDVLKRNTERGTMGGELVLMPDIRNRVMKFTFSLGTKRLSCNHMVGQYETGTACGCWTCPVCEKRGSCMPIELPTPIL